MIVCAGSIVTYSKNDVLSPETKRSMLENNEKLKLCKQLQKDNKKDEN